MTTTTTRRRLTTDELASILTAMPAAPDSVHLLYTTVTTLLDILLADEGRSIATLTPGEPVDPRRWAIPATQWAAISEAVLRYAAPWGTSAELGLVLAFRLPGTFDDPQAPVPVLDIPDLRPATHTVEITRAAADVIAACARHVEAIAAHYGHDSGTYRTAAASWLAAVSRLLSMNLGSPTRVRRDGPLSLIVTTGSGYMYGLLWHADTRWCVAGDACQAIIGDDGTPRPASHTSVIAEHEHQPAYPAAAPTPGRWAHHS